MIPVKFHQGCKFYRTRESSAGRGKTADIVAVKWKNICLKRKQKEKKGLQTFEPFSHILKRSIKVCYVWTSLALFVRPATRCSDPRGDQNGSWLQIPSGANATLTHSSWANFILIVLESIKCSKSRSFPPSVGGWGRGGGGGWGREKRGWEGETTQDQTI